MSKTCQAKYFHYFEYFQKQRSLIYGRKFQIYALKCPKEYDMKRFTSLPLNYLIDKPIRLQNYRPVSQETVSYQPEIDCEHNLLSQKNQNVFYLYREFITTKSHVAYSQYIALRIRGISACLKVSFIEFYNRFLLCLQTYACESTSCMKEPIEQKIRLIILNVIRF